jgi:hypothetical protein
MADWIACPSCGLKHSARPDGSCPRCRQPVSGAPLATVAAPEPVSPPAAPALPALPVAPDQAGFPAAWRVAGALFVAFGIFIIATSAGKAGDRTFLGAAVVDTVVGAALLAGKARWRGFAIFRVVVGGLVFTPVLWFGQGPAAAALQLVLSLSFLALLVGRPGVARLVLGAVPGAAVLALGLFGTAGAFGGDFEAQTAAGLEGARFRWHLVLPPARCHARPPAAVAKLNAAAERMAYCPDDGAQIAVIAEEFPNLPSLDVEKVADLVVEGARRGIAGLEVVSREKHPQRPEAARLIETRGSALGVRYRWHYGVYVDGRRVVQAIAQVPEESAARSHDELARSVSSLTF